MNTPHQAPPFPQQPMAQPPQPNGQLPPQPPQPAVYGPGQPPQPMPAQPHAAYPAPKAKPRGKGMMITGLGIGLVGLLITVVTFLVADPGGQFVVAFGPMIFGAALFVRGLISYLGSRS